LDLPTYFLDLTPFVPILTDGNPHAISLDVVSAELNHTINQNWYLSAALQIFTDPSSNPTTGKMTQYSVEPFSKTSTVGSLGRNGDLNVTISATRQLHIESTIISGSGIVNEVVWDQSLEYNNVQNYLNNATIQVG
jgi:Peptide N-acetyl-beta-D-glucosaminyl asparaginase amidase A